MGAVLASSTDTRQIHAWAGLVLHRLALLLPGWRYLDNKAAASECS